MSLLLLLLQAAWKSPSPAIIVALFQRALACCVCSTAEL
jgi:hypothetical protein